MWGYTSQKYLKRTNKKCCYIWKLQALIDEKGCKLEFLPPYSPDFNPIKYSFSVIKCALKGAPEHHIHGTGSLQELANKVLMVAKEVVTPEIAKNQYRHCNIQVAFEGNYKVAFHLTKFFLRCTAVPCEILYTLVNISKSVSSIRSTPTLCF